jgi:phospholipid transport system substrate-binding protein
MAFHHPLSLVGSRMRIAYLTAMIAGAWLLCGMTSALAATEPTPTESVKNIVSELIQILDNQDLNHPNQAEERTRQIEHTLRYRLSYEELAKRSLGGAWGDLNATERKEFVDLFVQFLARSLAGWRFERDPQGPSMKDYSDDLVVYVSEQRDRSFSEVRTRFRSHKVDTLLDFRLVNQAGNWRVYDVVIDHVSLTSSYRSQFASIIRFFSLAELEEKIKKTIPILKLFERLSPP